MKPRSNLLDRSVVLLNAWSVPAVILVGGMLVIKGWLDVAKFGVSAVIPGALLLCFTGYVAWTEAEGRVDHPRPTWQIPALWVITAWGAARLSGPYAEVVGAAGLILVALYMAQRTYHEYWGAAVCALWMDGGLAYRGALDSVAFVFHVAFVIGVCVALRRAPALREARAALRRARAQESRDAEVRNAAREFGLLTRQAPRIGALPSLKEGRPTVGRATLDFLSDSFRLQTKILRSTMGLNTAAVLWITPDSMTLRGMDTVREDVLQGPYQRGEGAPGSLLGKPYIQEMSLYPVTAHHRIPYYESTAGVGAALMVPIPAAANLQTSRPGEPVGVLCLDRAEDRPFTLEERAIAKAAARKIALDVATGQRLKATDHERSTVRRFCAALQSLNGVLGLDQVGQATLEAVRDLVAADLAVLSLVKDDVQRVVRAVGTGSEQFSGLQFSIQDGLAGQAIRVRYPLPSGGEYNGNSYVFTRGEDLSKMRSLLVVPLLMPEGEPVGSITVAARAEGAFRGANREMLDLIAGQVAIKLDLAHAHDQISELATTDGITGLKNHRTFQQAFDTMLSRASRQGAPLSVVMCDIDHFKRLNDSCGHPFGDEVLRDVACVLRNAVRQVDLAARYGGEEFALLLEDSGESGARLTADRIRREVEALEFTHPRNGSRVSVTISLGIAVFSSESVAKAELIQRADDAMYYAKENGRNQVRSWSELPIERPGPPNPPAAMATMAR